MVNGGEGVCVWLVWWKCQGVATAHTCCSPRVEAVLCWCSGTTGFTLPLTVFCVWGPSTPLSPAGYHPEALVSSGGWRRCRWWCCSLFYCCCYMRGGVVQNRLWSFCTGKSLFICESCPWKALYKLFFEVSCTRFLFLKCRIRDKIMFRTSKIHKLNVHFVNCNIHFLWFDWLDLQQN